MTFFMNFILFYSPTTQRKRSQREREVVIVGGGFAGAYVAKALEDCFRVTLVDNKDYFEFTPSVLRTIVEPNHGTHMCPAPSALTLASCSLATLSIASQLHPDTAQGVSQLEAIAGGAG